MATEAARREDKELTGRKKKNRLDAHRPSHGRHKPRQDSMPRVPCAHVDALSFGCYGAAMFLGRVRPLRDAYEYLSRAYDRVFDRLGQKVLRDSRDTPALRLMVSLSLTAVPIFVIQFVLGKPRL